MNVWHLAHFSFHFFLNESIQITWSALLFLFQFHFSDGTTIKSVSENVITNPGDDATLSCNVEGKPLTEDHIRWERLGYVLATKTKTTFVNGTSYLHIKNARREDVGNFRCIADNRVANPTSRDVLLVVKCKSFKIVYLGNVLASSLNATIYFN